MMHGMPFVPQVSSKARFNFSDSFSRPILTFNLTLPRLFTLLLLMTLLFIFFINHSCTNQSSPFSKRLSSIIPNNNQKNTSVQVEVTTTATHTSRPRSRAKCWKAQPQSLISRSYLADTFWPYPPFRIVLERESGACGPSCTQTVRNLKFEPEYHVREAISSFLTPCLYRESLFNDECMSLDIGGNVGFMTAFMATMGSRVITIEGQRDYAEMIKETAAVNCWENKVAVLNVALTVDKEKARGKVNFSGGWRGVHTGSKRYEDNVVDIMLLDQIVNGTKFDLVKIDLDGIDGLVLERFVDLIEKGQVEVTTFIVELHHTPPNTLFRLQQKLSYDIYRLNMHADQRFFGEKGWDVYSMYKPIALEEWAEERFHQRFMTYLLYVKPELDIKKWESIMKNPREWVPQFVITKEKIMEHREEHPLAIKNPSKARKSSGWHHGKNSVPSSELYQGYFGGRY